MARNYLAKAKVALGAKDTATALKALDLGLKAGQKPAEANYYMGAIALARGHIPNAIRYLEEAVRYDDENVDAFCKLGEAHVRNKDVKAALPPLRRALKLAPKNGVAMTAYGGALLAVDSVDAAIVQLTRAKEYLPNDPAVYEGLGDAYGKQNVVVMVVSNYQKAIELEPGNVERRIKLANVYEKDRKYTEAVREYDEIIKLDSTNADAYMQKGNILLRAKLYRQAVPPLRTLTQLQPKSVEASVLLTKALSGAGDNAEVVKEAKRSLKMDSTNTDVWRILAQAHVDLREYTEGLSAYDALKRRKAFKPEDQAQYGLALARLGRDDEALKSLLEAVAMDSTNCDAFFSLGAIYMKKRDYENAAGMFEKRITCDTNSLSLPTYLNAAASYMQTKNYPRVRELLTRVIEVKPDFLQARLWLARYYSQVDSLDNAKSEYDEVLKQIGSNTDKFKKEAAEADYLLGMYYFRKQSYGSAVELFRKASSLGYEDPGLRLTWGQAVMQTLDRTGNAEDNAAKIQESIRLFRKVIELDPNNAQGHLWLAQGLIQSRVEGEDEKNRQLRDDACGELRKVLKIEPKNEDAKKAMVRIGCPGAK